MGMKHFKAYTPSRRNMTVSTFEEVTKKTPEKSLLATKKKNAGRNSYGRITVRHQGGGNRQKYRIIDFKRKKDNMEATVIGIEYDPNRTANIALIEYTDGERAYILAPQGLTDGDKVVSGETADIKPGNCMPISNIPVGTMIHNIELNPGQGGKLVRSAGQEAQLMAKEGKYAHVRLPSGEMRLILARCRATIGTIGNADYENMKIGKAGRKRHMADALKTIGKEELEKIIQEDKKAELVCHFCNKKYEFSENELSNILEGIKTQNIDNNV